MSLEHDVCYLGVRELGQGYRRKQFTALEVAQALLGRIERLNPALQAYLTVTADVALQQARSADQALARGDQRPLLGVPLALKDLYLTRGIRTTAGSRVLLDWVPQEDSTCTARLAEAGSVLLGKVAMHEFAYGRPVAEGPVATGRNPWNRERVPAGSSSGSGVAAAAGLATITLGSDTGGSIRGPANNCAIVGIKPTHGRVSTYGVLPMCWSLDNAGPMCRTVEDNAIVLQAIAGRDPRDPQSSDRPVPHYTAALDRQVRGLRLGVPTPDYLNDGDLHPEIAAAVAAAVEALRGEGAEIKPVRLPNGRRWQAIWSVFVAETVAYHRRNLKQRPQDFTQGLRERLYLASTYTAADLVQAHRHRRRVVDEVAALFRDVDVIAMPSALVPPQTFAEASEGPPMPTVSLTSLWNMAGFPALTLPCGFTADNLPIGLQLIGRPWEESTVFRVAHAYEQATDWHTRRPPVD